MDHITLVEKKLADEPIKTPKNPFWDVFQRFGRDEAIALVINVAATALIEFFLGSKLLRVIVGPVVREQEILYCH